MSQQILFLSRTGTCPLKSWLTALLQYLSKKLFIYLFIYARLVHPSKQNDNDSCCKTLLTGRIIICSISVTGFDTTPPLPNPSINLLFDIRVYWDCFYCRIFFPYNYKHWLQQMSCIRPNEWKIKWRALKLTTCLFPQLMAVVSPHWMSLTSLIIQTFPFFFLKMNVKSFQTAHQIPASKSSTNLGKTLYWSFCSGLTVPKHMAPCRISYWIFSGWQPKSNSPRTHKVQLSPIILNSWIDSLLNSLKLPWVYRFSKVYILFLWLFSERLGISKHKYEG